MPKLDKAIAKAFAEALTGGGDNPLRFRMIHDKDKSRRAPEFTGRIDNVWLEIAAFQADGYGCFYFLNEVPLEVVYATDQDVTRVRALPADFDNGLPTVWHAKPNIIVHTSAGRGQALWLTPGLPVEVFKPLCKRIIAYYPGADPAVCNLSRVLRLPGSLHLKREPTLVTYV